MGFPISVCLLPHLAALSFQNLHTGRNLVFCDNDFIVAEISSGFLSSGKFCSPTRGTGAAHDRDTCKTEFADVHRLSAPDPYTATASILMGADPVVAAMSIKIPFCGALFLLWAQAIHQTSIPTIASEIPCCLLDRPKPFLLPLHTEQPMRPPA